MFLGEDGGAQPYRVDIEYEWVPSKCLTCRSLGHSTAGCPTTKKTAKPPVAVYVQKPPTRPSKEPVTVDEPGVVIQTRRLTLMLNFMRLLHGLHPRRTRPPSRFSMIQAASWNVRGLNRQDQQMVVRGLIVEFNIHFIGLLETRVASTDTSRVQSRLLHNWKWFVDPTRLGNRIWLAWDDSEVDVNILLVHNQCIHCRVIAKRTHVSSLITVVYGLNEVVPRRELWEQLVCIVEDIGDEPWLVLGDFNTVLDLSEVHGTSGDISIAMVDFQACFRDIGLLHVPMLGETYTWHNCSDGPRSLWKKLDRMASQKVFQITNDQGICLTEEQEVVNEFISFFENLLGGQRRRQFLNLNFLRPWARHIITVEEEADLTRPVLRNDVKTAVFDIAEDKAPGPDGYLAAFYKAAKLAIDDELTNAVQEFFNTGKLLKQINATLLTLIPKVAAPSTVGDYRPISCCNVLYKIITKIIVQRMQQVMQKIVSPSQNAFVLGRRMW
ncbi:UNVERIFIED_CONTAM: LINE-1 retrotransposable element O protein [Sesamum latifolium]|uniref:LINE-1 retrotransposable element O protein n=1 Tax=Sesamum latifolium TaxID=2727402 RepID=A0AAW2XMW3_9LAMI